MIPSLLFMNKDLSGMTGIQADGATDLDLFALFDAMADGQPGLYADIFEVFQNELATCPEDILYRQAILRDALIQPDWFRELNQAIEQAFQKYDSMHKASQPGFTHFLPVMEQLQTAVQLQGILLELAISIKSIFGAAASLFQSTGMNDLHSTYDDFYSSDFLNTFRKRYAEFRNLTRTSSMVISARPGHGLKIADCQIRLNVNNQKQDKHPRGSNLIRLSSLSLQQKANEMRDTMLRNVLNLVKTINEQMAREFRQMGHDISFYIGCLNLKQVVDRLEVPVCFPQLEPGGALTNHFRGLIDVGLALRSGEKLVPNTLDLDGNQMMVITGANQGGKSTFLRSVGLAQVMMQAGLFVTAESFAAQVCSGILTHFCRSEDQSLDSGKLDEELRRLDRIIDQMRPHALLLMNESFSSTSSHDGAVIAAEITAALLHLNTQIFFVTHLYQFAKDLEQIGDPHIAFLRAERYSDGMRSFQIKEGTALPTSFGLDLFNMICLSQVEETRHG